MVFSGESCDAPRWAMISTADAEATRSMLRMAGRNDMMTVPDTAALPETFVAILQKPAVKFLAVRGGIVIVRGIVAKPNAFPS